MHRKSYPLLLIALVFGMALPRLSQAQCLGYVEGMNQSTSQFCGQTGALSYTIDIEGVAGFPDSITIKRVDNAPANLGATLDCGSSSFMIPRQLYSPDQGGVMVYGTGTWNGDGTVINLNYTIVMAADSEACAAVITSPAVGIADQLDAQVQVYPQPADDMLRIDFKGQTPLNQEASLLDVQGRVVRTIPVHQPQVSLSLTDLEAGLYFLRWKNEFGANSVKQIMVSH